MERDLSTRQVHPAITNEEIWPGPDGYPWANTGARLWTREGLLRSTGGDNLVATWTTGGFSEPADGNFTMIAISGDRGRTWDWSGRFQHPHHGLFTTELFSPREGEIHAFLQTYRFGEWMTGHRNYRSVSFDHGKTWSTPNSIPGGVDNVWVNRGIITASGRWVIPVSWPEHCGEEWGYPSNGRSVQECCIGNRPGNHLELPAGSGSDQVYQAGFAWANRNHRYCCGVLISDDRGQSFRRYGYLKSDVSPHLIEPRVVELADGHIAMLLRSMDEQWLWRSESFDDGESWTPAERSDIPGPSAKVNILKSADGRIFLIHNPVGGDCNGGTFAMNARNPLSLWVSSDGMRSWSVKVDLIKDSAICTSLNYPDGYVDEANRQIDLVWEDAYSVFRMRIPLDIRND